MKHAMAKDLGVQGDRTSMSKRARTSNPKILAGGNWAEHAQPSLRKPQRVDRDEQFKKHATGKWQKHIQATPGEPQQAKDTKQS